MHSKAGIETGSTQLEKEAKLRTVIESVPNGIIMVDTQRQDYSLQHRSGEDVCLWSERTIRAAD